MLFSWFRRPSTVAVPIVCDDPSQMPIFDFAGTALAEDYATRRRYVKIVDHVFTPEECRALVRFAETGIFDLDDHTERPQGENAWEQAAVHFGMQEHQKLVDTSYRNSERILKFDEAVAKWVYERVKPYVGELDEIGPGSEWERVVGRADSQEMWRLVGVNERLSFLRYGPGHFFKEHCDGHVSLPDGREARVTLQIYLGSGSVEGGATRLWSRDKRHWVDVEPIQGRLLVFQHRDVLHSGQKVTRGQKLTLRSDLMFKITS
ncbi:hypothetical protein APHAL10511_005820 [Amanita phalloides]|nr:hypothetical protein APHAL10511_005820 [Amanita phalloides]